MSISKKAIENGMIIPLGITLLVGVAAGFIAGYIVKPQIVTSTQSLRENSHYQFIHPLLAVNRADIGTPSPVYAELSKNVQKFITHQMTTGTINSASVYFINYGKTGSFALNQDEEYDPASMLKVVVMVAFMKKAESDPTLLEKVVTYTPSVERSIESVPFQDPSVLKVGQSYSIQTLIDKMIIGSDNGAMNLLLSNIDDAYLTQVYSDLGLSNPEVDSAYTISAKDYSLFFRVLYNATYLSSENSEKALALLSRATFADGLVAGMPEGTTVAHKFGEHVTGSGDTVTGVELHDCGIVYAKEGGPYLLCVMTKGKNLDNLKSTISTISKMVYDEVSK